jgi:small nuclear ribonucleoprotein G
MSSFPKSGPGGDLRKFLDKRLDIKLNGKRRVMGILRGHDQFMNLTIEEAVEVISPTEKEELGTVVIRGNSIEMWECIDRVR